MHADILSIKQAGYACLKAQLKVSSATHTACAMMQGELENIVNNSTSTLDGFKSKLLSSFGPDSPLSDPQLGSIVQTMLSLLAATGGAQL